MSFALFYQNPRPLDAGRDANLKVREIRDLSFCRDVNTLPINLVEFPHVARYYPIGFVGETGTPMAIVGLQRENLFLDKQGRWKPGFYVPAFVRRYPFIFADTEAKDRFNLCIDVVPEAVSEIDGQPLFANGQPTPLVNQALEFCRSFHQAAIATDAFAKALVNSGLLIDRQADTQLKTGVSFSLKGFKAVDTEKLRKLPARTLGQWNDKNWLAPLYAHVQSMNNWSNLLDLAGEPAPAG